MAAVTAFVVLGTLHAVGTPAFAPPDETAHVAYALSLSEGVIPHIASFPDELPIPGMPSGLSVWTANHPPGAYALMAIPLRAGVMVGQPRAGFLWARMLNVLGAAVALVFVSRIVGLMLPHRPRVVVGTTMVVALVPYSVHIAGTAYTDGLAGAVTVGLLAAAVEVLVRGPSRWRLMALLVGSASAALIRAPSVVLVLLAGIAWGSAQLLHHTDAVRRRLIRAVLGGMAIGTAALASAGWFFLGNVALYGDLTGSQSLFELHSRQPRASFWEIISASQQYRFQELQLWSKMEGLPDGRDYVVSGYFVQDVHKIILGLLWISAVLLVWHVWRTRLRGERPVVAAWVLLAVWWWALMAMMALFVSQGGAPHARYLTPAFAGLALLLTLSLDTVRARTAPITRRLGATGRGNVLGALLGRVDDLPVGLLAALGAMVWANAHAFPRMIELFGITRGGLDLPAATLQMLQDQQVVGAGWMTVGIITALSTALIALAWSLVATPVHATLLRPVEDMGVVGVHEQDEPSQVFL